MGNFKIRITEIVEMMTMMMMIMGLLPLVYTLAKQQLTCPNGKNYDVHEEKKTEPHEQLLISDHDPFDRRIVEDE